MKKIILEIITFIILLGIFTGLIPATLLYILAKYPITNIILIIVVFGILCYEFCFKGE